MNKKLPKLSTVIVLPAGLKKLPTVQFPRIPRFITETPLSRHKMYMSKLFVFGFLCGFLLLSIVLQCLNLRSTLKEASVLQREKEKVVSEINYWKGVAVKYKGYRDVYVKLAALEYKIGNVDEAKNYMKLAYDVDPNFEAGKVLGTKIGY